MDIQSLSLCVPAGCPNNCKFCVSQMHEELYPNQIEGNIEQRDLYEEDYLKRLQFARDNGCNTLLLTGSGEPLTNRRFLKLISQWNRMIEDPFRWIELQTSGVLIDDECLHFIRHTVQVATISLSLSNMFDSKSNAEINGTPDRLSVDVDKLCKDIRTTDCNLRLSLNMNAVYNDLRVESLFERARELGANQITFRKLYRSGDPSLPQNQWIEANAYGHFEPLRDYIKQEGRILEVLPFGATRYSVKDMSVVLDADCMSTEAKRAIRYLVLRANCKLYTKWDDVGSLLF